MGGHRGPLRAFWRSDPHGGGIILPVISKEVYDIRKSGLADPGTRARVASMFPLKGVTQSRRRPGTWKEAVLENGVPLSIAPGELVRIDTRTGKYLETGTAGKEEGRPAASGTRH